MIGTLFELIQLDGVSGDEDAVRDDIVSRIKKERLEHHIDRIGNLIVKGRSNGGRPKVMLAAHMDEVGFIIHHITDDGKLKFAAVGGLDSRILTGLHVCIGENGVPGVIGYKSVHLQDKKERGRTIKMKNLYIDIGAKDREEAENFVALGDYASFTGKPVQFGENRLKAKALDDRAGCAVLLELLKETWPFELYACFTVQEEVGLRGARLAANRISPDMAVVLEGTTCSDVPEVEDHSVSTILGKGPALTFVDRTSIGDRQFIQHFVKAATENEIPFQWKQTATGGNDAGKIQVSGSGVKTLSVSVPCRYIHSPVSVLDINDLWNMYALVKQALFSLPKAAFHGREEG